MATPQQTPPTAKVHIEHVQTLVDRVLMPMSPCWLVAIGVAVVISLFDLSRTADGAVEVRFGVSTVSALLIALVWLPFLLKAIVLGGGTVKLQPVETSLPGLLDLLSRLEPETQRQVLPAYIQSVEEAETKAPPDEGFVEAADVAQGVSGGLADGGVLVGFQPAEQRDRLVRVLVVVVIRNRRSSCDGRIASRQ